MEVKTVAVIGAGTMGRGIAYAAALGGFQTVLEDVSEVALDKAIAWIHEEFEEGVIRGRVESAVRDAAVARITTSRAVTDAIRDADLVIEAVPEDLATKKELFAVLDQQGKTNAVFASNTSSFPISDFTGGVNACTRCIGMHFFNPVPKMKLVEIVRTAHTSEETVATCMTVAHCMHKETVVVKETPGFITSRINALIGNEAFAMLEAGTASAADIDKAIKLGLSHPMGPFEMVDLVGLDVRLKILEYLHGTLGEKYRPNVLLRKYVAEGRLGRKTGRGVYDYSHHESKHEKREPK